MAVITLENGGEDVTVGGADVTVRGTASGGEEITVVGGNIVLDASFGLGGDTVVLPGVASQYSAVIVGSRLILSGPGTEISIPLSPAGINVEFSNGDTRFIEINDDGQVVVGDQVIPMGPDATDLAAGGPLGLDFTPEADDLQGTAGDDVFDGSLDVALGGLVGVQTLQGADSADGGEGTDTLNAELNSTGTTQNPQLANIEVYNLTSYGNVGGGGGTSTLNLARASGYEQLWNRDSTGSLTLNNVGEVAVLGMDGVQGGTTYTVIYDGLAVEEQTVVAMGNGFPPAGNTLTAFANLNITGNAGSIGQLNLVVSDDNALNLQGAAASATNVDIDGDGLLNLISATAFGGLETLDATGYDGDLVLDISGDTVLESALTGDGDDVLVVDAAVFSTGTSAPTTLDMGEGENRLILEGESGGQFSGLTYENLDFTLAPVSNVQVLELDTIDVDSDTVIDLEGIGGLEELDLDSLATDGTDDLTIVGGPEALVIRGTADAGDAPPANLDMNGANLTVDDTTDLTLVSSGEVQANLYGDSLENVTVTGGSADIFSDDITTLETLSVAATGIGDPDVDGDGGDAVVDLDDLSDADDEDFASLESVNVSSVDGDATLELQGTAGTPFQAGLAEIWELTVNSAPNGSTGSVVISSQSLTGGSVLTDYTENAGLFETNANDVADDIAADLNGSGEPLSASVGLSPDNSITIEWDDVGGRDDPSLFTTGGASFSIAVLQDGADVVELVPGTGFESLTQANVLAAANATANLEDVYGSFELNVVAGENADVDLINTQVTEATVSAVDNADVVIGGDTVGAQSLTSLTVSATTSDIDLSGDLSSLNVIDVTGVTEDVSIDAEDAGYEVAANAFVQYLVGNTDDGNFIDYDGSLPPGPNEEFVGDEDIRIGMDLDTQEVVTFTSADFGEARLGLDAGTDQYFTVEGDDYDRIDLSALGFTNAGQLQFEVNADGDLVITDLAGQGPEMSGTIVIDIDGDFGDGPGEYTIDDFASNNIIFA
ncbi:hypothetical protein GCM10023208_21440 [Erythrobacter westpacificensis]|uniref:Calcium-binding protein n=1 Tax=Erythrobacter westpacificensis TaxID=1055231 RepID=A0ABP9KFU8_9SPHN